MAKTAKRHKRDDHYTEADWGHFINLLKVLTIVFIAFSSFHWIVIKMVQPQPAHIISKYFTNKWSKGNEKTYSVKEGDTLWEIAFKQYPARNPQDVINEIKKLNKLTSDTIKSGQPLRLP